MSGQIHLNSKVFRPVLIFLLTVILLVGLLPYGHIRLGSTEISAFEDNDDLFDGRYLVEDDDRHNDGPNPNESTNNPTIFGFTRSPSAHPSLSPSVQPSIEPSGAPSFQPSIEPSGAPSLQPSYDPCRGFYGNFGDITGGSIITVAYEFGVESNKIVEANLNATLSDQVREVESAMLELLIESLFPVCRDLSSETTAQRFLYSKGNEFESILPPHRTMPDNLDREKHTKATEELKDLERENSDIGHHHSNIFSSLPRKEKPIVMKDVALKQNDGDSPIIGISSSPIDLANGKKCQTGSSSSPSIRPDCNVIEGRLELNLSDLSYATNARTITRQHIKEIMDGGLLDESHPAILSVMFMQDSRLEVRPRSAGGDDDIIEVDTITPIGNRYAWMAAAGGLVAMTALTSAVRYRYSSAQESANNEVSGLDDEAFVEVESRDLVNELE